MATKSNNEFLVVLAVLVVGLVLFGLAGLFFRTSKGSATTYEECMQAAGSTMTVLYPRTCITKDKHTFVNPNDKHICGKGGPTRTISECKD